MVKYLSLFIFLLLAEEAMAQSSFLTSYVIEIEASNEEELANAVLIQAKDKTIVGLGEVSHFTKECFELKGAIIQDLMRNGFDALVLEVDFGQALLWNNYVCKGEGNLDALISESGWFTYRTEEFKSILKDIHEFNLTRSSPFQIFGMEMTAINHNLTWLKKFFEERGEESALLNNLIDRKYPMVAFETHSDQQRQDYWALYFETKAVLGQMEIEVDTNTQIAERIIEIIRQYAVYISQDAFGLKSEFRDQFSARNVLWSLQQCGEEAQIMIWAHNGHIAKQSPRFNYDVLGHYLEQWFGEDYYAVGFTFNYGEFGAFGNNGFEHFRVEESDHAFWTDEFAKLKSPLVFLPIKPKREASRDNFEVDSMLYHQALTTPQSIRMDFSESHAPDNATSMQITLKDLYDGLIYFEESHAATAIPWTR